MSENNKSPHDLLQVEGILEPTQNKSGVLLDPKRGGKTTPHDPFVPRELMRRFKLRKGSFLTANAAQDNKRGNPKVRFIETVDHPNCKMMYDTFHANIEEKGVAEAIRACSEHTVHVHISENDRSTPGSGNVDWNTTFDTLKETGYEGWMMVEAFGLALPELAAATKIWRRMYESEEQLARDSLSFMKSEWAKRA